MAYKGYLVCMAYRVHGLRCNCLCIAVIYGLIARNSEAYIEPIYIYIYMFEAQNKKPPCDTKWSGEALYT